MSTHVDASNFSRGRAWTFCAVEQGELTCWSGHYGGEIQAQMTQSSSYRIGFEQAFNTFNHVATRELNDVTLWRFESWGESPALAPLLTIEGRFEELYSHSCGRDLSGDLRCWSRLEADRRAALGAETLPTTLVLTAPRAVSVRGEYTWCAVLKDGQLGCGLVP